MDTQQRNRVTWGLSIMYFITVLIYSVLVFFEYEPLKGFFGFVRVPILALLYFCSSVKRDYWYFLAFLFFQAAYLFFGKNTETCLFYGAAASVMFRLLMVIIIYKAIKEKRWFETVLTALPFLFVHLYFIDLVSDVLHDSIYLWILNGLLTSFLGGLSVANFFFTNDRKSVWLFISALLFVVQIGLFFINKFYLKQQIFLQMVIVFYGISNYTFYRFMILKEEEEQLSGH
ncbi:hypothetical protein [Flavobacterium humi]|uniref:Lysoplasmalogenase n=1 Tax=Flavobacterium humi TaxID=2562683 RepID=A0A4Z0L9R1_9FLAO|nr:hypothetical protein [Flavobacterium humi]TGD59039.1 hypothetical protein E4635_04090 [Flavobacterium humi]